MDTAGLAVQVLGDGDDAEELDLLVTRLRDELTGLDVDRVEPVDADEAPDQAKGLGTLAGVLFVKLGGLESIRAVVSAVASWAGRNRRAVEVTIDGDTLKVSGVSSAEQEKIIDAWLARHGG